MNTIIVILFYALAVFAFLNWIYRQLKSSGCGYQQNKHGRNSPPPADFVKPRPTPSPPSKKP